MMSDSENMLNHAASLGTVIAHDLFVFMLNPKHRGPTFTWDKLEDLAVRQVRNFVPQNVHAEFGCIAERSCRDAVRRCLRGSGVCEWLPLGGE